MVLEYFKLFISWPFLSAVCFIIAIFLFKEAIQTWLKSMKIDYKDLSVYSQSNKKITEEEKRVEKEPSPPQDNMDKSKLVEVGTQWKSLAYYWEYRYLGYYLVPHTKDVLKLLYDANSEFLLNVLDVVMCKTIPEARERIAVVDALQQHYLIQIQDNMVSITEKGKEYIEFYYGIKK